MEKSMLVEEAEIDPCEGWQATSRALILTVCEGHGTQAWVRGAWGTGRGARARAMPPQHAVPLTWLGAGGLWEPHTLCATRAGGTGASGISPRSPSR